MCSWRHPQVVCCWPTSEWQQPTKTSIIPTRDARMIQTAVYRSWDLFHAANSFARLQPRHDTWAFGCLVYEVAQRHPGIWRTGAVPARLSMGVNMCSDHDVVYGIWMSRVDAHVLPAYKSLVQYCLTMPMSHVRKGARLKVTVNGALQLLHQL